MVKKRFAIKDTMTQNMPKGIFIPISSEQDQWFLHRIGFQFFAASALRGRDAKISHPNFLKSTAKN